MDPVLRPDWYRDPVDPDDLDDEEDDEDEGFEDDDEDDEDEEDEEGGWQVSGASSSASAPPALGPASS